MSSPCDPLHDSCPLTPLSLTELQALAGPRGADFDMEANSTPPDSGSLWSAFLQSLEEADGSNATAAPDSGSLWSAFAQSLEEEDDGDARRASACALPPRRRTLAYYYAAAAAAEVAPSPAVEPPQRKRTWAEVALATCPLPTIRRSGAYIAAKGCPMPAAACDDTEA